VLAELRRPAEQPAGGEVRSRVDDQLVRLFVLLQPAKSLVVRGEALLGGAQQVDAGVGEFDAGVDSMQHWQNTMCGHAAANILPVVASNRIGREKATASDIEMTFYGSSFIADRFDNRVEVADRVTQTVLTRRFDLDEIRAYRESWGPFRDRRPDLYSALGTFDGRGRSLAETAQAL
jgi:N-carbamoylputrescine amidase